MQLLAQQWKALLGWPMGLQALLQGWRSWFQSWLSWRQLVPMEWQAEGAAARLALFLFIAGSPCQANGNKDKHVLRAMHVCTPKNST